MFNGTQSYQSGHGSSLEHLLAGPPVQPHGTTQNGGSGDVSDVKPKKTRKRQQTSCISCHAKKQKCDKQVPCDRCIKRGEADTCRIMDVNEKLTQANTEANTDGSVTEAKKRKRANPDEEEEGSLAARVRQLEDIIRLSQLAGAGAGYTQGSNTHRPKLEETEELVKREPIRSDSSSNDAIEEAAVAALSTLSKAVPLEGGSEARIYSGPGSVTAFLAASGFSGGKDLFLHKEDRARPKDLLSLDDHSTQSHPLRLSKLAEAIQEFKAKLPPAAVCHYLFNFYHSCHLFKDRMRNFPRGCYQYSYDALFEPMDRDTSQEAEDARALGYPQLASEHSLAFLSMVFVTFAISLSLSPDATPDTHALASVLYEHSRAAFTASERREQPSYPCLLALLSQSVFLKLVGCPSVGFTILSSCVRYGQAMGMHREPGPNWGLSSFEAEIRRRLWWNMAFIDKQTACSYGRPYNICPQHCDVELPTNINDADLTADGPTNVRPAEEVTEMTISLIQARFAAVLGQIMDRALSCKPPTYGTIIELDNLMTHFESESVPAAFRNPSLTDLTRKPYLRGDLDNFISNFSWNRSLLHRPYLLRPLPRADEPDHYAGSRAVTIMLSKKMLNMHKERMASEPINLKAYFGCAFNAFDPAVNLCTSVLQDPFSAQARVLDTYVQEGMRMLEEMSTVNRVANEGLDTLKAMRTRYLQAMQVSDLPHTTPSGSTTGSSNDSPSSYPSSGPSPNSSTTSSSSAGQQTLAGPPIAADNTATPNTLFNQFFGQNGTANGSVPETAAKIVNFDNIDIDQLFNFDPSVYNNDPSASWLTDPIIGGLDAWPDSFGRLEGEMPFTDWKQRLGF